MRKNDKKYKLFYRTDRFFKSNGEWFFHTREGADIGPFATPIAAQIQLKRYLAFQQKLIEMNASSVNTDQSRNMRGFIKQLISRPFFDVPKRKALH